ncbi:MAG TPA: alpha-1,4-glucan--maltose-1-phosphate maltosyltransferase, partial [Microbacterium sp.]|nr:alpha-1,4-glucan--maltose-1-phosphate maltosyltransferase [Microbacterium sp.]
MVTSRTAQPQSWRSAASIPVRPASDAQPARDTAIGRIPTTGSSPTVPDGDFRPKAFVGEVVPFEITAFRDGHDRIGVQVRLTSPGGDQSLHRLNPLDGGMDRWSALVSVLEQGVWRFRFEAFSDEFATWRHAADVKIAAGVDTALMREIGARLFTRGAEERSRPATEKRALTAAAASLRDDQVDDVAARGIVLDDEIAAMFWRRPLTALMTRGDEQELLVERERAGVGAWYEFFPRSEGATVLEDGSIRSGTFATATERLPAVAAMGFDVLYLPPIHPIGRTNRKGPNNSLDAGPADPGSPWAIGSADGGHDAVHPDLGTLADFRAFVQAARTHGVEVALDLALQASPDHPWVTEHPEWFTTLPDGSIAYAENPPKKYQDIYPINFDNDP